MYLTAEEIANGTFYFSYLNFRLCRSNHSASHDNTYLFTHDPTRSPPLNTWVTHVKRMRRGQGHVRPISSVEQFFTASINTHVSSSLHFHLARALSPALASQNPSVAATSSSPVRKSFTASTSSPSYSRRLRISSLRRRHSRLPLPS